MSDLFFSVKIIDAAKRLGSSAEFVKDPERVLEKARLHPPVIVLDLNCGDVDPVHLLQRLKSDPETSKIPVVAFVSHVQTQLKQDAERAGCDVVVARSAFSQNLTALLERYLTPAPDPAAH